MKDERLRPLRAREAPEPERPVRPDPAAADAPRMARTARRAAHRADRPGRQVRRLLAQVLRHLHLGRRVRADLGLALRDRLRPADPRPRARPLPRGAAPGPAPALPVFIPFLGAYVAIKDAPFDPWRNGLVSIAGPIAGGLAALATLVAGEQLDSRLLLALAYTGFFLNLFNLIPIGVPRRRLHPSLVPAAAAWRGRPRPGRARRRAWTLALMSGAVAVALVVGMIAAHVPQDRL